MFRVQDECRIKTKSKRIEARYFSFAYEQLVESIWYLFYHEERISRGSLSNGVKHTQLWLITRRERDLSTIRDIMGHGGGWTAVSLSPIMISLSYA